MALRIEIWCEGRNLYGEQLTDLVTVRVPSDIKIIDSEACKEMLKRRQERIKKANEYRRNFNSKFKNQIELDICKKELKEKLYTTHIKGWTPIITRSALEFICQNF